MTGSLALRAGLGVLAAACIAWFALDIVQQSAAAGAQNIITAGHVSRGQARRANALLDEAATLAPGVTVTDLRAQLEQARGDLPAARRFAARAAHAEPQNADAWLLYTRLSQGTPLLRPVFRHLLTLVPPVTGH